MLIHSFRGVQVAAMITASLVIFCTGCTTNTSSGIASSSAENIPLILFDTPVNIVEGPAISDVASVDPELLWQVVSGEFHAYDNSGTFGARAPDGTIKLVTVSNALISALKVSSACDFGIYFIPAYVEDGENQVTITDMKLYNAEGKLLVGDSCDAILDAIIASESSNLAFCASTATLLDKNTMFSELEPYAWYVVTDTDGISVVNDTGSFVEVTTSYYTPDENAWDKSVDVITLADFPNVAASKGLYPTTYIGRGHKYLPLYFSFSFVEDEAKIIEKAIHNKTCILVSALSTNNYARTSEEYIYNDTPEVVKLSYTVDKKTGTCTLQPGDFMRYLRKYKELHIISE